MENHEYYIRESLKLADSAVEHGNHPFGALLVKDGESILTAENTVITEHDVTGHAETNLVRIASKQFDSETLSQCTLYTSTEPCAMCAAAIYWAGIPVVIFSCSVEKFGELFGHNLNIPCREVFSRGTHKVEVIGPVLEGEALLTHNKFWK